MPRYRILDPALGAPGPWVDADILDPALAIPGYMRPFRATGTEVVFDIFGLASTAEGATEVTLGAMTIDAFVGWEDPKVKRANGSNAIRRGATVVEFTGSVQPGQVRIAAEAEKGAIGYLRLNLAAIPAATAIGVIIVRGGRPL